MIASLPLLASCREVATAIAASGVSLHEEEATELTQMRPSWGRRVAEPATNPYLAPMPHCPECGTRVVRASACVTCPGCGWGKCG
ncbi:MAG TPA: hypothetical protein VFN22_12195 [Gemmatimonadales bacterium]|nr:hypothetical protein [Gemmatimonadales bacterium]